MPKRIPVNEAQRFAEANGLRQVVIIGFDGDLTHIVTWGETPVDCKSAAQAQAFWKGLPLGYPFLEQAQKFYDRLRRIARDYRTSQSLLRGGEFGLDGAEALEYAYDNIQSEAAAAIRGQRRPEAPKPKKKAAA